MRLKDRKAIWLKKMATLTPIQIADELSKLERELERKNEDVTFTSKIHVRTEEGSRRYYDRKISQLMSLVRDREREIEYLERRIEDLEFGNSRRIR